MKQTRKEDTLQPEEINIKNYNWLDHTPSKSGTNCNESKIQ